MTKDELAEKILRRFGHPMVKVELDQSQIYDAIDYARSKFIKYAIGQATHETWITFALSGSQHLYDLPVGVTEVVAYNDEDGVGGINTLFTVENFLYNEGIYNPLFNSGGSGYNMISYHIALDFLESMDRYTTSTYNWKYHPYTNQLEIQPPPPSGNALLVSNNGVPETIDSPGFALLKVYMIEGSTVTSNWEAGDSDNDFYNSTWMLDCAEALCKITLGRIRSKFESFASIGNTGIALDGSNLISEGREDLERLMISLVESESYEGFPIIMG